MQPYKSSNAMNEQLLKAKEWWSGLAERERKALTIAGIVLAVFIVYQFVWAASLNAVSEMRKRIETQQKLLVWMQSVDKDMQKKQGNQTARKHATSPVSLLSAMQEQIKRSGLDRNLKQLKQASSDSVEAHFQKISFDKLISLLGVIIKENSVSISQLTAVADAEPGIVNVDLVIKIS